MSLFKIYIKNRDYTEWEWKRNDESSDLSDSHSSLVPDISPVDSKLFHNDVIDQSGKLISSSYRDNEEICGVLLTSEKTYGRNSKDKLLFKCIPDDEHLPYFLIPYEVNNIGFSKIKIDKLIHELELESERKIQKIPRIHDAVMALH